MNPERFGLEQRHWTTLVEIAVKPLQIVGCTISFFGSRARGDFQRFSDLDLLVEGEVPAATLSLIREALDESNLPFRVDLVLFKDLAESYQAGALRDKVEIAVRDSVS